MMSMRRDDYRKCKLHIAVLDEAERQLALHDGFAFEDIVEAAGYSGALSSFVNWDYIRDTIMERIPGQQLIPVAPPWVTYHDPEEVAVHPGKFVAWGRNKKRVGFVWISERTRPLSLYYDWVRRNLAKGQRDSYVTLRNKMFAHFPDTALSSETNDPPRLSLIKRDIAS